MDFIVSYGVDIALIVLVIIDIVHGAKRGFVRSVLSLASVIISLVVAFQLAAPAAEWSYDTFVSSIVEKKVEEAIPDGLDGESVAEVIKQTIDTLPPYLVEQLEDLDISINELSEKIDDEDFSKDTTAKQISDNLIKPGVLILLKMLSYIIIYMIARSLMGLLIGVICKFFKLPVLKTADKWLGAALGAVKGVAVVFVLCSVMTIALGISSDSKIKTAVDNSKITDFVGNIDIASFERAEPKKN